MQQHVHIPRSNSLPHHISSVQSVRPSYIDTHYSPGGSVDRDMTKREVPCIWWSLTCNLVYCFVGYRGCLQPTQAEAVKMPSAQPVSTTLYDL